MKPMNNKKRLHVLAQGLSLLLMQATMLLYVLPAYAQKIEKVHGVYTFEVSDEDNVTLREAKRRCIEMAKGQALREKFGSLVASDIIESNVETNDGEANSQFWENTVDMAQGEWLGETKPPLISASYTDGKLLFKAEVWGEARKIERAKTDIQWSIVHDVNGQLVETKAFTSGERLYVNFKSPASGFVAIYLIENYENTYCLLPYKNDKTGQFAVTAGRNYTFFDKRTDEHAKQYPLKTDREVEANTLVLIYSPNPFTKCIDERGDMRHPDMVSTLDFQKWLLKNQKADKGMMVVKKQVVIRKAGN